MVKNLNGVVEELTRSFKGLTDVETRAQFKAFVKELVADGTYDFIAIEDAVGGMNFRTNVILYQLNCIVDDMMYEGLIPQCKIERIDNNQWKKTLRQLSGVSVPTKGMDAKEEIRLHLGSLGYNKPVVQDVYDAMGMAVAVIYRRLMGQATEKQSKLSTDMTKGYVVNVFNDKASAESYADKRKKKLEAEVQYLVYSSRFRTAGGQFKRLVEDRGTDKDVYVFQTPLSKLGVAALKFKIDMTKVGSDDMLWLVLYKRNRGK